MASTSSDARELATREIQELLKTESSASTSTSASSDAPGTPTQADQSLYLLLSESILDSLDTLPKNSDAYLLADRLAGVLKLIEHNAALLKPETGVVAILHSSNMNAIQTLLLEQTNFEIYYKRYAGIFRNNPAFKAKVDEQLLKQQCTAGDAESLLTTLRDNLKTLSSSLKTALKRGEQITLSHPVQAGFNSHVIQTTVFPTIDTRAPREFRELTQPRTGPTPNIPVSQTFFRAVTKVPEAPGECKHLAQTYSYYTETDLAISPGITTHRWWSVFGDHDKPASWYGSSESLHVFQNQRYENTRSARGDALKSALLELLENDLFEAKTVGDFRALMTVFQDPTSDQHAAIVILATSQSRFSHNKTDSRDVLKTMIRAYAQDLGVLGEIEPQLESLTGGQEHQAPSNASGN